MKILVYDIAAEDGGGLQVLKNFIDEVSSDSDDSISWYFIVSKKLNAPKSNIHILAYPDVKKSWLSRILFEHFKLTEIVKSIDPDFVFSMQNTVMPHCKKPQAVFFHQPLPFCRKRFSFFKKEERSLAFRQKVICGLIFKNGLKKADRIFVQTKWMKSSAIKWLCSGNTDIQVAQTLLPSVKGHGESDSSDIKSDRLRQPVFFYPAAAYPYKNHDVVISACKILEEKGIDNYTVVFTLSKDENTYTKRLSSQSAGLPVIFSGNIEHDEVNRLYKQSVVLFPSYLESLGLPLYEAKSHGCRIIASNTPFADEALSGYDNCDLFECDDAKALADIMLDVISVGYKHTDCVKTSDDLSLLSHIKDFSKSN